MPHEERIERQLDRLERLLEATNCVELPVGAWYELGGYYLGLVQLITEAEHQEAWRQVAAFRRGRLQERKLCRLAHVYFTFSLHREKNRNKWRRDTGWDASRWARTKANPTRHEKVKVGNAASQRRRRAKIKAAAAALEEEQRAAEDAQQATVIEQVDDDDKAAE